MEFASVHPICLHVSQILQSLKRNLIFIRRSQAISDPYCLQLISSAIQRCRLSGDLCRLSVILKFSPNSDPLLLRISISDTGIGSCLEEFQDLKFPREAAIAEKWVLLVLFGEIAGICDNEVFNYQLNLKESASARRLTRLPPNPKNVCLSISESLDVLVAEINCFFQKVCYPYSADSVVSFLSNNMLVLKIPNVAYELVVEHDDASGLRYENVFLANESNPLHFSASNLERLKSGLEDYILKHGNSSNKKCGSCFPSLEHLKVGSGIACCTEGLRNTGLVMEAVILISEISEPTSSCFRPCGAKSEALTSIDWRSYGLTLGSIMNQHGYALLEWEGLPPSAHIDIVLHCYHDQYPNMIPSARKTQLDRNLIKKSVKLALDDLKEKHAGVLLSAHALK
ncbi:type 2 dna topoisomerase 6 subunit b-like, partial [Quercus suber]